VGLGPCLDFKLAWNTEYPELGCRLLQERGQATDFLLIGVVFETFLGEILAAVYVDEFITGLSGHLEGCDQV